MPRLVDSVVFLKGGCLLLAGDADDLRQDRGMSLDALFRKEYR
ncbi:ABC transporter ATP-binding protein [Actinomyces naeslundii]|nr:ABC transporter ATP-binding protein [Actinomyces naeslundii]